MSHLPPKHLRRKSRVKFPKQGKTEQSHAKACDIHNIIKRFDKTGIVDHVNQHQGQYVDVASAPDYQEAMNIVCQAQQMFETLPARIRDDFQNDPERFLAFIDDPDSADKLREYGLLQADDPMEKAPTHAEAEPRIPPDSPSEGETDED